MTIVVTNEAIAAAAARAHSMGFALNNLMVASILSAGFAAQFGPDVTYADPDLRFEALMKVVEEQGRQLAFIVNYLNANDQYIQALKPVEGEDGG